MTDQNIPPKNSNFFAAIPKPYIYFILIFLILGIGTFSAAYWYLGIVFDTPADPLNQKTVLFQVKPGMTLGSVARDLEKKEIIRAPLLFRLQVRLLGGANQIHVGTYEFKRSMTPRQIYVALTKGRVAVRYLTIPEGFDLEEIASAVEKAGLGKAEEILSIAKDPALISKLNIRSKSLEGYLFPDTYRFPLGVPAQNILIAMAQTLQKKLNPALRKQIAENNLSFHQILTLASLIEKETSVNSERPLIAAVFLNRLRKNMRLQSDPTVIYALPNLEGELRHRHLSYNSPYNTYRYKGLPPGPIASPGLASIRAVLNPAEVDYLYFVATREGGHKFSNTYKEHQKAVAQYRNRKEKVDR